MRISAFILASILVPGLALATTNSTVFPPENPQDCVAGSFLTWQPGGSVRCAKPAASAATTTPSVPTAPSTPSVPTAPPPGTVVGSGSCPETGPWGCEAGSWSFSGAAQPGGCSGGYGIVYTRMGSYTETMNWPTAYNCITQ